MAADSTNLELLSPCSCKPEPPLFLRYHAQSTGCFGDGHTLAETSAASRRRGLPRALGQRALWPKGLSRKGPYMVHAFLCTTVL